MAGLGEIIDFNSNGSSSHKSGVQDLKILFSVALLICSQFDLSLNAAAQALLPGVWSML